MDINATSIDATSSFPTTTAVAAVVLTSVAAIAMLGRGKGKKEPDYKAKISGINIYPIKSCAEIKLDTAVVNKKGFEDDRLFQVACEKEGDLTLCTARDKNFDKLFHIKPFLTLGRRLKLSSQHTEKKVALDFVNYDTVPITSTVMGDKTAHLDDYGDEVAAWIKEATGIPNARLVGVPLPCACLDGFMDPNEYQRAIVMNPDQGEPVPPSIDGEPHIYSLADEAPFLLTTKESLADLNERLKARGKDEVDERRFRPNIVIEGLEPWEEDCLKRVRIGKVEFHVWQRAGRCAMTTIDRDTLERGPEPLATLSTFRERANGQRNFGMHLIPILQEGTVRIERRLEIGDGVEILEYDEARRAEWQEKFGKK